MGNRIVIWGAAADRCQRGYTLLELIVVMALIGIVFFIATPRLHDTLLVDQNRRTLVRIMNTARELRIRALREQADYLLHCDIDANRMWVTRAAADEEAQTEARRKAEPMPQSIALTGVAFPGRDASATGRIGIRFRRQGYADLAVIHLRENDRQDVSIVIHPFLSDATLYETRYQFPQ